MEIMPLNGQIQTAGEPYIDRFVRTDPLLAKEG
jgi:hypothetical protein